jgi:hypothetical protein
VRGNEDHRGRALEHLQVPRELDAAHLRHVHVDQDDIRFRRRDHLKALYPVCRLPGQRVGQL